MQTPTQVCQEEHTEQHGIEALPWKVIRQFLWSQPTRQWIPMIYDILHLTR